MSDREYVERLLTRERRWVRWSLGITVGLVLSQWILGGMLPPYHQGDVPDDPSQDTLVVWGVAFLVVPGYGFWYLRRRRVLARRLSRCHDPQVLPELLTVSRYSVARESIALILPQVNEEDAADFDPAARERLTWLAVSSKGQLAADAFAALGKVGGAESLDTLRRHVSHRSNFPLRNDILKAIKQIEARQKAKTETAQLLRSSQPNDDPDGLLRAAAGEGAADGLLRIAETPLWDGPPGDAPGA